MKIRYECLVKLDLEGTSDGPPSSEDVQNRAPSSAPEPLPQGPSSRGGGSEHVAPLEDSAVSHRLGPAEGVLLAWCAMAPVNALMLALATADDVIDASTRARIHLYDLGHALLLGVASYLLVALWQRSAGPLRRWGVVALGLAGAAAAAVLLEDDIAGFVQRREAADDPLPWPMIAATIAGMLLAAAALVGRLLARRWLRLGAWAVGLGVVVVNHLVLTFDYPGLHLLAACCAAIMMGRSFAGLETPRALRLSRVGRGVLVAVLGAAAAASVVVKPNDVVWRALFSASGSVLAPFVADAGPESEFAVDVAGARASWMEPRAGLPPVPPSGSPLLEDLVVIILTVDALRADVADDERHAALLPGLAALRRDGIHFTMARSPTPSTDTTVVSMFSGKYYSQLYWSLRKVGDSRNAYCPGEDETPTAAGLLARAGIPTVHVLSTRGLASSSCGPKGFTEEIPAGHFVHATTLMDRIIGRLERLGDGPLVLYAHFIDPHAPYNRGGTKGSPFERYLREVALVDAEIGRLRAFLGERGALASRTVLIVAADHGEAFGEHNTTYHARTLYEEALRVPLFALVPGSQPRRIDVPVTLMDIGPTVLDMYGLPTPSHFMGESLLPFLRGGNASLTRPIAADAGRRMQAFYFPDGMKAIIDLKRRTRELYDLTADPGERRNLMGTAPDGEERHALLSEFFRIHALDRPGYTPPWRRF